MAARSSSGGAGGGGPPAANAAAAIGPDQEAQLLDSSLKQVKEQGFLMKRAIDQRKLDEALEKANEMLKALKTINLSPKRYNELYMKAVDEMRDLEEYLFAIQRNPAEHGHRRIGDIYEQVQGFVNVIPRLYLLCCVGGVYICSKEAPAKDILTDMAEMIKCVQHPMKGLFLRNYLSQVTKNKLPDVGSPYEGVGGTVQDAYVFVLKNYCETNRLWIRLQSVGNKDKKEREQERLQLRILVGTNLVRLSQLEGLDAHEYETFVLPRMLDEVVACADTISQSYLMDCIIQVFPDELHLATLPLFLGKCTQLKEKVQVRLILQAIINRLVNYFAQNADGAESQALAPDMDVFQLLSNCVATLIEKRSGQQPQQAPPSSSSSSASSAREAPAPRMSLMEKLRLYTMLANFAIKSFPTRRVEYVERCLASSLELMTSAGYCKPCSLAVDPSRAQEGEQKAIGEAINLIEALLRAPLDGLAMAALKMDAFTGLMKILPWDNWRHVSYALLRALAYPPTARPITDLATLVLLLSSITPLLRDPEGMPAPPRDEDGKEIDVKPDAAFVDEQLYVAKALHLLKNDDTDDVVHMLVAARDYFSEGGRHRLQHTLPPLLFIALGLARRTMDREKQVAAGQGAAPKFSTRQVLKFLMETLEMFKEILPEQALKVYLYAAQVADDANKYHAITYEFAKEALLLHEGPITDSKAQVRSLSSIVGSLLTLRHLPVEDYEALVTKVAQYANKLLKKPDQSRMVALCSHLFDKRIAAATGDDETPSPLAAYSEQGRVLECLQRALKIASVSQPNLFVDILDRYIYFFEHDTRTIEAGALSKLVELITEQLTQAEAEGRGSADVATHFHNIKGYIRGKQQAAGPLREKFAAVKV
jgi:vacuolar protein sorting-associated protein 35